jgi:hypothetical protein
MSCKWKALMTLRERRQRNIRERKENIYENKKGINRERGQ